MTDLYFLPPYLLRITLGFLLLGCTLTTSAQSALVESRQRILQTAEAFIHLEHANYPELLVHFGYLDSRLNLPRCERSLEGYFPDSGSTIGQTVVGVRCDGVNNWKIVIPVQIRIYTDVVVVRESLAKDSLLQNTDLTLARKELTAVHAGAYTTIADVAGMILKRPVNRDTILTPSMLKPKQLVLRGEPVTILAQTGEIVVRVQGLALMDGHRGQLIRVRNTRSGKELQAEIIDPAIVRVKM